MLIAENLKRYKINNKQISLYNFCYKLYNSKKDFCLPNFKKSLKLNFFDNSKYVIRYCTYHLNKYSSLNFF